MAFIVRLKQSYDQWVVDHASLLSSFENMMRYSLYLVPMAGGPRGDSTIEGAYASVGLVALYHDWVFLQHSRRKLHAVPDPNAVTLVPPTWCQSAALAFSSLSCIELFIEMAARQKYSEKARWNAVLLVESLKAALRLLLLLRARGAIVPHCHFTLPSREELLNMINATEEPLLPAEQVNQQGGRRQRRTLMQVAAERQAARATQVSLSGQYQASYYDKWITLGEVLHILRPVLYLLAFYNLKRERTRSPLLPFLLSAAMDYLSRRLSTHAIDKHPLNQRESEELHRRRSLWAYYLLRSPLYEKIASFFSSFTPARLHVVGDYIQAYRDFYSYTAGSS